MWEQKCSEEDWAVPWRSSTLKVSPPHLCLQSETTHFSLQLLFTFFLFFFFLFHFPFSFSFFFFPFFCPFFFLFLSPFHFFCPQPAVEIIWNHLSSLFSYWIHFFHSVSISPLFDGCCRKIVIFLFRFSLFPSRICIGRAWLFFSYRLTSFSPLFLIWNRKCFISFSSKPTTANMALLCFLSSGFFDKSKSFISDVH